jgi:hypothetical protein
MKKLNLEGKIDLGTTMLIWRGINVPENIYELVESEHTMKKVSYVAYIPDHICMVDGLPGFLLGKSAFAYDHIEHLPAEEGTLIIGYHS